MAKRAFILGAGASHTYDRSKFAVRPPLASGFFDAYFELPISEDFNVKVGSLVNYVRDNYGIQPHEFYTLEEDVEQFFGRLDGELEKLKRKASKSKKRLSEADIGALFQATRARFELLLLFSRVLIDTTDGQPCPFQTMFVSNLQPGDSVISFNWDTLLDRALHRSGRWHPDDGYGLSFEALMENEWRLPAKTKSEISLFKLHGSINWLISYPGVESATGKEVTALPLDRYHDKFCFVSLDPHPPFGCREVLFNPLVPPDRQDGKESIVGNVVIDPETIRYKFELKTYGDYTAEAKLAALIIPPTASKTYELPGQVFEQLWPRALNTLVESDELFICGYSLPDTDDRPRELIRQAAAKRGAPWRIRLVTPHPEPLVDKLHSLLAGMDPDIELVAPSFEQFVAPNTHDLILPGPAR